MRHGAKMKLCNNKLCSSDECTKYAHTGGVCIRHGAKTKLCITKLSKEECALGMEQRTISNVAAAEDAQI